MDPFTAALVGSTALQATGSIMQGNSQAAGLRQQASAADRNAQLADIQARQAYDAGVQNELAQRRSAGQQQADIRASVAESGFDASSGTALMVQEQAARDLELDALTTRYEALLQGNAFEQQAVNDRYTARSLRQSASGARRAGYVGAATSILSGAASYGLFKGMPKGTPKTSGAGGGVTLLGIRG